MASHADRAALDRLAETVYAELRILAARYLRRERQCHTLQPTALANEALVRILGNVELGALDRTQFLAIAAHVVRQVLVDHARARARPKRGGRLVRITLHDEIAMASTSELDVLALDEALHELAWLDERQGRIVEMRLFAGLTVAEIASSLGVSKRTVETDWTLARVFLQRALRGGREGSSDP
ncbi:MAG: ECF-type sigma factor [Planctomycetota bacterium]